MRPGERRRAKMYFETPVLHLFEDRDSNEYDFGTIEDGDERLWACLDGMDAWFVGLARVQKVVLCFSTTPVDGAVQSEAHASFKKLSDLFKAHYVAVRTADRYDSKRGEWSWFPGQPIWWWVEIVTDGG